VAETRFYAFHSDPWVNLHHFLYQWSRAELGLGEGRTEVPVPEREGPQPEGADGLIWRRALDFYVENVGRLGHFDDGMLELKSALIPLGGDPAADPPDDIPGIAEHLRAAMPVYGARWWPTHDAANRGWIAFVEDDVRAYEQSWVETVTRSFGGRWVDGRLRVDASAYANWQGGYTSNGPSHTVIWSTDATVYEGLYSLELVFHESGHASTLGSALRGAVREVFREADVAEPANLRHAILFATAGELVRGIAWERGLPEHVPMMAGLLGFRGWGPLWPPLEEHWLPVVHGRRASLEALEAIAEAMRAGEHDDG
jgi:hypothetical protein